VFVTLNGAMKVDTHRSVSFDVTQQHCASTCDQTAKPLLVKRRRSLRLPHAAHHILSEGLATLRAATASRCWTLPTTSFSDEVTHYHSRHKKLGAGGPRPKLRLDISSSLAEEQALKVDAALSFAELGERADPLVKPILFYYAWAHLCGVYSRTFFEWDRDSRSHGLTCIHKPRDVANTQITIGRSGQFPRIAVTCFLLTGQPSCFSPLVTYSQRPTAHIAPGELLENFGKNELGVPILHLTLHELVNFEFGVRLKAVRQRHRFHTFRGLPTTAFLLDVLTLFVGSSLARYDVLGWKQILEGKDNAYRIHFEETYERFLTFGIDFLLASLEGPLQDSDRRLIPSQPSPYSHDDRSRFRKDPNHEP
jgi:hypothetical protein